MTRGLLNKSIRGVAADLILQTAIATTVLSRTGRRQLLGIINSELEQVANVTGEGLLTSQEAGSWITQRNTSTLRQPGGLGVVLQRGEIWRPQEPIPGLNSSFVPFGAGKVFPGLFAVHRHRQKGQYAPFRIPIMISGDKGEGVLLGLACGDALGEPVEGWWADQIAAEHGTLTEFVGGRVPPGGLTDDTEQALRLARSLVECEGFAPDDVSRRFVTWYEGGAVGIGGLTRRVLGRIADGEHWERACQAAWEASPEGKNAGNGSVMRCAPIAVAYAHDPDRLGTTSRTSSKLTHYDPRCVYGCELLNRTIAGYLRDESEPLRAALSTLPEEAPDELVSAVEPVPDRVDPDTLSPTGYVVDTLQAAAYHALTADDAEAAIVNAVNDGGDADTIGAIVGAIAGARFGASQLPDRWLTELHGADELRRLGRGLVEIDP